MRRSTSVPWFIVSNVHLNSSKRSFEQLVWTPGPLSNSTVATTATSASSTTTIFTPLTSSATTSSFSREFSKSTNAGQDSRTLYYATPGFQVSPSGPDEIKVPAWPLPFNKLVPQVGKIALEVVTELECAPVGKDESGLHEGTSVTHSSHEPILLFSFFLFAAPSPPLSPSVYLTLNPWTIPEYMLLLSIKPLSSQNDDMSWDEIAAKLNAITRHQPRSAWDCWHRWMVPWCRPKRPSKSRPNTYPHAPGVQHDYKFADLEGLIELWTTLTSAMGPPGHGDVSPLEPPEPKIAAAEPRRVEGRAHHPGVHIARLILCAGP